MATLLATRTKVLVALIVFSAKVTFDLVLHRTTTIEASESWLRAIDERALAYILADNGARNLVPLEKHLRKADNSTADGTNFNDTIHVESASLSSFPSLIDSTETNERPWLSNKAASPSVFHPSKYAYAYVIGGCNPDNGHYKGFLYNILVSTRILREEGARADIIVLFQISHKSNATALPEEDIRWLSSLGIKVEYIPKSEVESFYDTVMNKFRILALTQYRRVLLMDGDVMPIGNLDYLFEMSDGPNATMMENVIVMGHMEPANAGFFMLAPGEGEYERLLDIVHTRETEAANMTTWPKFDQIKGWGHVIDIDDQWESRKGLEGTKWNFHFAFSDQGLLFHWTKYVKRRVSIIHGHGGKMVQNWAPSPSTGKVELKERYDDAFKGRSQPRFTLYLPCRKFMCDFIHFTGKGKVWMHQPPANITSPEYKKDDPSLVWWHTLSGLNDELLMGLNFSNWTSYDPPLGLVATLKDLDRRVQKRKHRHMK